MGDEIWKDIKGYEGLYQVSNYGRIKALSKTVNRGKCHRSWKEHYLKYGVDNRGYYKTHLSKNGVNKTVKVHRIVAQTFINNQLNKKEVNHKDGNKQNNTVDNLEWVTKSENQLHAYKTGLNSKAAERNPAHKLTWKDVNYIRANYQPYDPKYGAVALGKQLNVHRKTIMRVALYQLWKSGDANVKNNSI